MRKRTLAGACLPCLIGLSVPAVCQERAALPELKLDDPRAKRTHGEASVGYESWWLNASPAAFSRYSPWDSDRVETGLTVPATPWTSILPAASIGGPLGPPGLSYHLAGSARWRTHRRQVVFVDDPEREKRDFSWFSWSGHVNGNVTFAPGRQSTVRAGLVYYRSRNRGGAPALEPDQGRLPGGSTTAGLTRAPFEDEASAMKRWKLTGSDFQRRTLSLAVDHGISRAASVSADFSVSLSNSWTPAAFRGSSIRHVFASSNAGLPNIPAEDVEPAGYADHDSSYGTVRDRYVRSLIGAELTWSPPRLASHLFAAGLRSERVSNDVYIGHARPTITLNWKRDYVSVRGDRIAGPFGYYSVSRPGTIGVAAGTTTTVWLEDRWSPHDRVSLQLGLRAEREAVPTYAAGTGAFRPVFGFSRKLAPRLSARCALDAAGRWKAGASFGLFYDHLKVQLARSVFGGERDLREYWTLDTLDWKALSCDVGRRDCAGVFIEAVDERPAWNLVDPLLTASFQRPSTRVDPGLRPMRTGEWEADVEGRLSRRTSLSVRFTGKWLAPAVEDVGLSLAPAGETMVLANPGAGYALHVMPEFPAFPLPAAARRYSSLEVQLRRRTQAVTAAVAYRWSRLTGNYGGLASAEGAGRESSNTTASFDSLYSSYDRYGRKVGGRLPADRPHALTFDAALLLASGTTIAVSGVVESGRPESSEIRFRGARVYFNGYGDLGRQPCYSQIDLQVRQDIGLGGSRRLTLEATVDNLLNQRTVLAFFSNSPYRDNLVLPEAAFFQTPWDPSEWVAGLRADGVRVRDEQLFRVADRFQRPRRASLAAVFSF